MRSGISVTFSVASLAEVLLFALVVFSLDLLFLYDFLRLLFELLTVPASTAFVINGIDDSVLLSISRSELFTSVIPASVLSCAFL